MLSLSMYDYIYAVALRQAQGDSKVNYVKRKKLLFEK